METSTTLGSASDGPRCCAVIGAGRVGTALAAALPSAGLPVIGPLGRGASVPADADVVLLCVPDAAIGAAAQALPVVAGRVVGHCSGATGLAPVSAAGHDAFSLHPLMTVSGADARFAGAGAAVDGTSARSLRTAEVLADLLGLRPVRIREDDRAAYHAAASIASNFLVTVQDAAEALLATTGAPRELLVPLVRASVENWAAHGGERALTGPIARGDEQTVALQRETVAERTPELLELFDVLAAATRSLVERRDAPVPAEVPA
ncbi:DUF2520 domain-containing protein [Paraconexibacter sp.]|uniref:DUF2520 domain-containing protein n=1 Tax=Paraconexibacter sp. TaxID=2949640 RepID=UPI0035672C8D